ncbi:MAG: hypothetical protein ACKV19_28005 [Verrucomicrobiales bacterium]
MTPALRPMGAVAALYGDSLESEAQAVFQRLSDTVFGSHALAPSNFGRQLLSLLSCRIVKRTTRATQSEGAIVYRNRLIEGSGHPYARALLSSSHDTLQSLVEGGDPMNGPYMMIVPEIRAQGDRWDRIFFDSLQGRDVQLRFIWETRATTEEARRRLRAGRPVHLSAVAAGTGLSLILAYERLLRDGHDPAALSVTITDREPANTEKTRRLLAKLPLTRDRVSDSPAPGAVTVLSHDAFADPAHPIPPSDVLTAIGIFEYLQGHTCTTSEHRLGEAEQTDPHDAPALAARLASTLAPDGSLIVNTYQPHPSTGLLETFGKRFDFRTRADLASLLALSGLQPVRLIGSGHIYDVEVYQKKPS